jgi:hypothetical protein
VEFKKFILYHQNGFGSTERSKHILKIYILSFLLIKNFRFKMRDFILTYNKIVDTCFNLCVFSFNKRELVPDEV